ncbi:MAG: hypothetical protein ABIZ34_01785 [Candidatus Limnocylindrales bacterium]
MTTRDQAQPSADHQFHDQLLIVRFASDDVHASEVASAKALIDRCRECATLSDDLRSIARATAAMPAPRRQRDFRITADEAQDLRGTAFDRWLRRLAAPRLAILQPLAGSAIAIGLVLVVIGAGLPGNRDTVPATDRSGQETVLTADATKPPTEGGVTVPAPNATDMESSASASGEPSESSDHSLVSPVATALPSTAGPAGPSASALGPEFATASTPPTRQSASPTDPTTAVVVSPVPSGKTQGDAAGAPGATGADEDDRSALGTGTASNPLAPAALIAGSLLSAFGVALLALMLIARRRGRSTLRS